MRLRWNGWVGELEQASLVEGHTANFGLQDCINCGYRCIVTVLLQLHTCPPTCTYALTVINIQFPDKGD